MMMRERGIYIVSMMHGIHTPPYSSTVDIVPHKTTRPYIPHNMSLNNEMTARDARSLFGETHIQIIPKFVTHTCKGLDRLGLGRNTLVYIRFLTNKAIDLEGRRTSSHDDTTETDIPPPHLPPRTTIPHIPHIPL